MNNLVAGSEYDKTVHENYRIPNPHPQATQGNSPSMGIFFHF